jgi:acetyltransferase-like isoleucine patch superfamily enzyme
MHYTRIGTYDKNKAGHPEMYYSERYCNMDYRGNMHISPLSYFGFGVTVITASHDISSGEFSVHMILKDVTVGDFAWICTNAILYNCEIQHHAIVAIGALVKNMTVLPYTIVSGNPAVVTARWDGKTWVKT